RTASASCIASSDLSSLLHASHSSRCRSSAAVCSSGSSPYVTSTMCCCACSHFIASTSTSLKKCFPLQAAFSLRVSACLPVGYCLTPQRRLVERLVNLLNSNCLGRIAHFAKATSWS